MNAHNNSGGGAGGAGLGAGGGTGGGAGGGAGGAVICEVVEEEEEKEEEEVGLMLEKFRETEDEEDDEDMSNQLFEDAFTDLCPEEAAVLRNLVTMETLEGATAHLSLPVLSAPSGSAPPTLLFHQALMMTSPPGRQLSAGASLRLVDCFLQHGAIQLVRHAFTCNKLTFSEPLGDVLTEHAQNKVGVADVCDALATAVYDALRLDRKSALSMCRRGLIHGAAEQLKKKEEVTEDCLWVLGQWPSLRLLQLMTSQSGRGGVLSVGVACSRLLSDPRLQDLALQLLHGFLSQGPGVLEQVMLGDLGSSLEVWCVVASQCLDLDPDLGPAVLSVLRSHSRAQVLSPDLEGARLMEHIFL